MKTQQFSHQIVAVYIEKIQGRGGAPDTSIALSMQILSVTARRIFLNMKFRIDSVAVTTPRATPSS